MMDPWTVLKRLKPLLADGGVVVASIPNVRQIRMVIMLALGRWDYVQGAGTVARPHIRFFTLKTIKDMVVEAGYNDVQFPSLVRRSTSEASNACSTQ
jgi:hypothetical protein